MGEGRTRRIVASGMMLMLLLLVPASAESSGEVLLEISLTDGNEKPWYAEGENVTFDAILINHGLSLIHI